MARRKLGSGLWRDRRGATAIEFALVSGPLFLLVFATFELSRFFFVQNSLAYAVEETSRYAMVNPALTQTQLQTYTAARAIGIDTSNLTITVTTALDAASGMNFRTIQATIPFHFYVPGSVFQDMNVTAQSRMLENTT